MPNSAPPRFPMRSILTNRAVKDNTGLPATSSSQRINKRSTATEEGPENQSSMLYNRYFYPRKISISRIWLPSSNLSGWNHSQSLQQTTSAETTASTSAINQVLT